MKEVMVGKKHSRDLKIWTILKSNEATSKGTQYYRGIIVRLSRTVMSTTTTVI